MNNYLRKDKKYKLLLKIAIGINMFLIFLTIILKSIPIGVITLWVINITGIIFFIYSIVINIIRNKGEKYLKGYNKQNEENKYEDNLIIIQEEELKVKNFTKKVIVFNILLFLVLSLIHGIMRAMILMLFSIVISSFIMMGAYWFIAISKIKNQIEKRTLENK